jgi:hypothetical protein
VVKLQYGWIVVAAGALMGCEAIGTVFWLAVFLQPMSDATGWSRTGISNAMTIVCRWVWARSVGARSPTASAQWPSCCRVAFYWGWGLRWRAEPPACSPRAVVPLPPGG